MKFANLFKIFAAGVLSISCSNDIRDARQLHGPITIDGTFSKHQQDLIVDAIGTWFRATRGKFNPKLEVGYVTCNQPFAIVAVHELNNQSNCNNVGNIINIEGVEGNFRKLGVTQFVKHSIAVTTQLNDEEFKHNVEHELGHFLFMMHEDGGVMSQNFVNDLPIVTRKSIKRFNKVWKHY